jgi:hypothetical protein
VTGTVSHGMPAKGGKAKTEGSANRNASNPKKTKRNEEVVVVGNMRRHLDIFFADGAQCAQLSSPYMTAIPCVNAVHPLLPIMGATTSSGRVHIWK